jgi:tRNA modification GTPase
MMRYAVLTPPGTGAIAVLALRGGEAWEVVRKLFRPVGKPLPDAAKLHVQRLGNLGDGAGDEVVLLVREVTPEVEVEIHCHGGPQVVRMLSRLFETNGATPCEWWQLRQDDRVLPLLAQAMTLRNATILLDQYHGALRDMIATANLAQVERLLALAPVGLHLVTPWKVAIVGRPNAGKSSLMNALAGYSRSVVTATPGTTRDVVRVELAFDGMVIEFADTAGLRDTSDDLESEGIRRARQAMQQADLVLRLVDATDPDASHEPGELVAWNKCDLAEVPAGCLGFSAVTKVGLAELIATIRLRLEPILPEPGEAVPYSAKIVDALRTARADYISGATDRAYLTLSKALAEPLD